MSPARDGSTVDLPPVPKTLKLYIGGAFPRSESGRCYRVLDADGRFWANAADASRKDARDAVTTARAAQPGWAAATAYNRGQVLYRVAEMIQSRQAQFVDEVARSEGVHTSAARAAVEATIERWVWYAGWTDKIAQVAGNLNPVAGPYFSISVPEPTGVVAVVAPQASSLLGLVSVIAPPLVTGNTVVVLTSRARPVPAVSLAEVLATSDVPPGVVNLLTAGSAGVADWLASHADVNALDLCGCDPVHAVDLEQAGAQTLKRVLRPPSSEPDWTAAPPGPHRILRFTETKTVWHPKGT